MRFSSISASVGSAVLFCDFGSGGWAIGLEESTTCTGIEIVVEVGVGAGGVLLSGSDSTFSLGAGLGVSVVLGLNSV